MDILRRQRVAGARSVGLLWVGWRHYFLVDAAVPLGFADRWTHGGPFRPTQSGPGNLRGQHRQRVRSGGAGSPGSCSAMARGRPRLHRRGAEGHAGARCPGAYSEPGAARGPSECHHAEWGDPPWRSFLRPPGGGAADGGGLHRGLQGRVGAIGSLPGPWSALHGEDADRLQGRKPAGARRDAEHGRWASLHLLESRYCTLCSARPLPLRPGHVVRIDTANLLPGGSLARSTARSWDIS